MRTRFTTAATLVTLTSAVACQQSPVVPVIAAPPIELRIRVSDSVLVAGEVDTLKVIVKNTLDFAVRLSFATQCQERLFIRDTRGVVVLPAAGTHSCTRLASLMTLPARDSIVRTYLWTGGQSLYPPDPAAKLAPGRYFVSASLEATNYSVSAFPVAIRLVTSR
ncbi:MAG: hypothetical protein MNPFHGCM_00178 [Gemmatimonadaceae bacterium]|nr:hypothetical protein [Gemmatimonadaceae bacterium]